ncbi:MAG: FAD-binding protein [Rhodospirillaceae bacterium]|nr:FAD-binding protein [Rhodospirillaceae bacterium]
MASAKSSFNNSDLFSRLSKNIEGDVLFDPFNRGRYSTDASIYQVDPIGVVLPKTEQDLVRAVEISADANTPILARGGGTSQCGQTVNEAVVIDCSRYLNKIIEFKEKERSITVQPGLVLDHLNAFLKPYGLFFPVDISTGSRATIGGMTANNSCGARSIHYGIMVDNVRSIDAFLPMGGHFKFSDTPNNIDELEERRGYKQIVKQVREIAEREKNELDKRFPKLKRRVGGYNLDTVDPIGHNMAKMLVGSEGTLATFKSIELQLHDIPKHRVMGVCHFPNFYAAMDATQHIVKLNPVAVELIDRTMIDLAKDIPIFRPVVESFVKGEPGALLLVEFASEQFECLPRKLKELDQLMGELGYQDAIVEALDPSFQARITEVRQQGLNIMMSMKSAGKPVSFIEDCAVPLEDLAEYTDRLTQVFAKHGTSGTWYAHASVGCLHVRPILNMKQSTDVKKMRAIAEEAFEMVREYKGSHSGEHGDGIVRSEFHRDMFGNRLVDAFGEIKNIFDPKGLLNPGRIVKPPKMDDRSLFRYTPDYKPMDIEPILDWSDSNGFLGAVEMCNNNGACRKIAGGVMCPSYRVTKEEQHLTRGRANTLRLALSGQLGEDAFSSNEMAETMDLCVSCKGCRRECPTGVDMARMKVEVKHALAKKNGLSFRDRLVGFLPRYAEVASRFHFLSNLRDNIPFAPWLSEKILGFSAKRALPIWDANPFRGSEASIEPMQKNVVLLADTFNTYFEPDNLRAALRILEAGNYHVHILEPENHSGDRLCCGRTYLSAGLVEEAKKASSAMIAAYKPYVDKGIKIVGLEPSCLHTLRDEFLAMNPGSDAEKLADSALMLEEFLVQEQENGSLEIDFSPMNRKALIHGHCHQKAFGGMGAVQSALGLIPELKVELIDSSCCGMAGSFGYEVNHYDVSMAMAELDLLPAIRDTDDQTLIVADGTSCRHQIKDGVGREAKHVARILEMALG